MGRGMRIGELAIAACAAAGLAGRSAAQEALGSGHLLDANPLMNSLGYNTPSPAIDFAARNLLITGDVAGGRGFRGTVGYTAPNDFRGPTGSDNLYRFRAASAMSAPSFILGGSSLEQLRFGQYLNEIEYRRSTRAASEPQLPSQRGTAAPVFLEDRIALDRIAYSSTSAAVDAGASDLQVITFVQGQEGERMLVGASSLLGVQASLLENQGQLIGLTSFDMARARQDASLGRAGTQVGAAFSASFRGLPGRRVEAQMPSGILEPKTDDQRLDLAIAPAYLEVLQGVAERAAPAKGEGATPQLMEDLDRKFEQIREQLAKAGTRQPAPAPSGPKQEKDAAAEDEGQAAAPPAELVIALRHGQKIERLSAKDESRFNELMKQAEESLRDGEYFWAERHFDRALRFTPGHPLATAGLGHARIGAGLYAPAAITIQRLLSEHPEMIDVRYAPELLPSKARLLLAVTKLRELIAQVERDRSLHGFLLAYIGHQLQDRPMVDEGLAAMDPGELRELLAKIWAP